MGGRSDGNARGDLLELEGIRVALETLKLFSTLSIATVAGIAAFAQTSLFQIDRKNLVTLLIVFALSAISGAVGMLVSVLPLKEGESPLGSLRFVFFLLGSPIFFFVGFALATYRILY